MTANQRRNQIMRILYTRGYVTMESLARECGVSVRTIRRDIEILSAGEPIYTVQGRYGGGVYLMAGYTPDLRPAMDARELLREILARVEDHRCTFTDAEMTLMQEIVRG